MKKEESKYMKLKNKICIRKKLTKNDVTRLVHLRMLVGHMFQRSFTFWPQHFAYRKKHFHLSCRTSISLRFSFASWEVF